MQTDNTADLAYPPQGLQDQKSIGNLLHSGPTGQLFHYQTDPCVYIPQTPDKLWNNSSPLVTCVITAESMAAEEMLKSCQC